MIDRVADEVNALIVHGSGEIGRSVLGAVIGDEQLVDEAYASTRRMTATIRSDSLKAGMTTETSATASPDIAF